MTLPFRSFAVVAALALSACAANQIERKQEAAQSARDVSGDIRATNAQIDATLASLDSLMSADGSQLQPAFDRYSADVARMRTQAERINGDAADMRKQSQAYLTNWEKQHNEIQNQEVRNTSEQRRQTVMDRVQTVQASYDGSRTSLDQFIRNLDDVRIALRNDLTARGAAAIAQTNVVKNAHTNGNNVKNSLQEVQNGSTALAERMAPSAPVSSGNPASTNR
ncbi:MAG: DUF2959 family protein [Betaproteobacteria bacterium]